MTIEYLGLRYGGWIEIANFKVKYYFYWVKQYLEDEKVLAKVWTNG